MSLKYKLLLQSETALGDIDGVSTFDHIFSSIPVRLLDSHYKYSQVGDRFKFVVWDINHPTEKRYKTELAIDGVFLNTNSMDYYLFDEKLPYYKSPIRALNLELLSKNFIQCLNLVFGKDFRSKILVQSRFEEVLLIYEKSFKESSDVYNFYMSLLSNFYNWLDLGELGMRIQSRMISLYSSGIITKLIPKLIKETEGSVSGYLPILRSDRSIFQSPYFRSTTGESSHDDEYMDKSEVENNILDICGALTNGSLLPSQNVVSWALAVCGLQHYGNDHGFFDELSNYLGTDDYLRLQRTRPKQDGTNFVEFGDGEVFSYKFVGNKAFKCVSNPSRSMNLVCAYLHLGRGGLINAYKKWWTEGVATKIYFGKIELDIAQDKKLTSQTKY